MNVRLLRGLFVWLLFAAVGGTGVLAATGSLRFASAASPPFVPFSAPVTTSTASTAVPARVANLPSPVAAQSPVAVASPAATSSEIVAVASQTDQKLTLVDSTTGKASSLELNIPVASMSLAPNGRTAWVFSGKPGESDFLMVDLLKGERKDSKRLHDNPATAAFSTDGRRAYISLIGGNDSPPVPSTIVFLDTQNNDEFGHADVGEQSPGVQIRRQVAALGVAPGPAGDVLYAAGLGSGTVWAMDGGSGKLLQQIEVGQPLLKQTAGKFVADTTNEVIAIDTTTQQIVARLALPGRPSGAAVGPDGKLYITGGEAGQLWPVDPDMTGVGAPILVGNQPGAVAVSLDGARVYVADRGDNSLAVIDARRNQISETTAAMPTTE